MDTFKYCPLEFELDLADQFDPTASFVDGTLPQTKPAVNNPHARKNTSSKWQLEN